MTATLPPRRSNRRSRISVVVPCFNHGVLLTECLSSVKAQTVGADEVIVVDDGSTDAHTLDVLQSVERSGFATKVVRQANRGPAAARNCGVDESTGDLIYPLDADNRLLPTALASLRAALLAAPSEVRWTYPHQSFFGNRADTCVMPAFNLWLLLLRNFCDTGSLIDRSVFEAGCRYREDIGLGHEDWDFFLTAAELGFIGVPCHQRVLSVRKHGFTRSDQVDLQLGSFAREMRRLHPALYAPDNLVRIKQQWAPALSVVIDSASGCLDPLLDRQSFQDFEVVGACRVDGHLRSDDYPGSAFMDLGAAMGRWVLVWSGTQEQPLRDRAFLEKSVFAAEHAGRRPVVLTTSRPGSGSYTWRRTEPRCAEDAIGVIMPTEMVDRVLASGGRPEGRSLAAFLVESMGTAAAVDWRSVANASPPSDPDVKRQGPGWTDAGNTTTATEEPSGASRPEDDPELAEEAELLERCFRRREAVPLHLGDEAITRLPVPRRGRKADSWQALFSSGWRCWTPEHTRALYLRYDPISLEWALTVEGGVDGEPGWSSIPLGRVYSFAFPGTTPLWRRVDIRTGASEYLLTEPPVRQWCDPLGHVSTAHLPGMLNLSDVVEDHLRELSLAARGRPVTPFLLPGRVGVCIEPLYGVGDRAAEPHLSHLLWPLYEVAEPTGRIRYSTHPDAPAVANDRRLSRVTPVALLAAPNRTSVSLVEAVSAEGGRYYITEGTGTDDAGLSTNVLLGSLLVEQPSGILPMIRLVPVADGPHSAASEPGHRLRTLGWQPFVAAGTHVAEGILGNARVADSDRAPLYRWRHRDRPEWRYTLGCGVGEWKSDGWLLEGNIGIAFAPSVDWSCLQDLVELRHPITGQIRYAYGDDEEVRTHGFVRVVARLYRQHERSAVPVFRLRSPDGRVVHALNPDEEHAEGWAPEGPVAFVEPAVPPPSPQQPTRAGTGVCRVTLTHGDAVVDGLVLDAPVSGAVALLDDDDGVSVSYEPDAGQTCSALGWASPRPFPFAVPLYDLVERRSGRRILSTNSDLPMAGSHSVLRVAAYLGSPAHQIDAKAIAGAATRRAPRTAAESMLLVARRGARRLPPPARTALTSVVRRITSR